MLCCSGVWEASRPFERSFAKCWMATFRPLIVYLVVSTVHRRWNLPKLLVQMRLSVFYADLYVLYSYVRILRLDVNSCNFL